MSKSLPEIDPLYKGTVSKLPKNDRLYYCNKSIDKTQHILEKSLQYLGKKQKEQLREMIITAQNEIEKINNE